MRQGARTFSLAPRRRREQRSSGLTRGCGLPHKGAFLETWIFCLEKRMPTGVNHYELWYCILQPDVIIFY